MEDIDISVVEVEEGLINGHTAKIELLAEVGIDDATLLSAAYGSPAEEADLQKAYPGPEDLEPSPDYWSANAPTSSSLQLPLPVIQ